MTKNTILFLLLSWATVPALASEMIRSEVEEHVIDVCYTELVKQSDDLSKLDLPIETTVNLLKLMAKDAIEETYKAAIPMVANMASYEDRKNLYVILVQLCIAGAAKN